LDAREFENGEIENSEIESSKIKNSETQSHECGHAQAVHPLGAPSLQNGSMFESLDESEPPDATTDDSCNLLVFDHDSKRQTTRHVEYPWCFARRI
jgi:hypothetical protein